MKIRAFIIDDDKQMREALTIILKDRGYEVYTFTQAHLCPIYLDKHCQCPQEHACGDILLSDIDMPRMNGIDFIEHQIKNGCKGIRQNKALMSGTWTDEQLNRARKLGCQTFQKPIRLEKLNEWLEECEKRIEPSRKLAEIP